MAGPGLSAGVAPGVGAVKLANTTTMGSAEASSTGSRCNPLRKPATTCCCVLILGSISRQGSSSMG
jgi:hypothetical protein